jgi:glycosyltransferase involved in cell wall biosynthesis
MRFVFVTSNNWSPWGGSEELWCQTALRLKAEGHHVGALVPWWPKVAKQIDHLIENGIEVVFQTRPYASFPVRAWRKLKAKAGLEPVDRDAQWLLDQKPDLVCVSSGGNMDGLPFLEKCLGKGLPYVSIIHANSESMWPADDVADRLITIYRGARQAFFVSHRNRLLFETQLGISLNNAEVVRNPFNVRWDAAPPWPDESGGWKLACVGRYEPNAKGQDLLFQVLASEKWKVRPVSLSLFGAGYMAKNLGRLAKNLGIEDRVHIVGQVSDIEKIWESNHALLLASRYEGLPIVIIEAMLCGRPSIVTDVAGNAEMVEDGVSGFVAEAPTIKLVAEAMERAWDRRADWRNMGKAARLRVESLIPKDPIGQFCERLIDCAHSSRKGMSP